MTLLAMMDFYVSLVFFLLSYSHGKSEREIGKATLILYNM